MNKKKGREGGKCVKSHDPKRESRLNRTLGPIFKTQERWAWKELVRRTRVFQSVVSVPLLMSPTTECLSVALLAPKLTYLTHNEFPESFICIFAEILS